jgi:hypothetical protein
VVGSRDAETAYEFMQDLDGRLSYRVQLTTDGHKPYLAAVEDAFGADIDYAVLQKIYGQGTNPEKRYSPAICLGCKVETVTGEPDPRHMSTFLRRAPKPHDADVDPQVHAADKCVLKKIENHAAAVALYFMYYNFGRVHQTLRVTPAMEAGVSDHVEEIVGLIA